MAKKAGFVAAVKVRARPYQVCGVRRVLTAIVDAAFRAEVESAIGMNDLPATAIAAELTDRGFQVSDQSIARHRRRVCSCFKQ